MQRAGLCHRRHGAARRAATLPGLAAASRLVWQQPPGVSFVPEAGGAPSPAAACSAAHLQCWKTQRGTGHRRRPCPGDIFPSLAYVLQAHLGLIGHQVAERGRLHPSWDSSGLSKPTLAPLAQLELEILLLMPNEQDLSQFCRSHPAALVGAFQNSSLPTKRHFQPPKENPRSEGESHFCM